MPMTEVELAGHADRMTELLTAKRHQVENERMGPVSRAHLLVQIDALTLRVDEIRRQCEKLRGHSPEGQEAAAVIREAELSISRAAVQASHVSPT